MTPPKTVLKGMTWSDPRGYDPLIAVSAEFSSRNTGVEIEWDKRSLQGFESTPVDKLAAAYDLMIIDHPHVGSVARKGCLLALDKWVEPDALTAIANETVGKSFTSYTLDGHQWAVPVDAATQVQAHRPDRGERLNTWEEVKAAAQKGHVILPMRPPHSLMCLYTLSANIGIPCGSSRVRLLDTDTMRQVFFELRAVTDHIDPDCFDMDPIAALDRLASDAPRDTTLSHAPLAYLYKGYSNAGYRPNRLVFSDIPALGHMGPVGSALGGTGLAISARTKAPEICARFAVYVAGAECQAGIYSKSNGQPGNALAWGSESVNQPVLNAYWNTRATHEAAWLRPRHDGYMEFQEEASHIVNDTLLGKVSIDDGIASINVCYAKSFREET